MKSNSISNAPAPYGIDDVVSPRGLTYSVTCHQWLTSGACAIRILPTIWVHMCRVSRVAVQSSTRRAGQLVVVATFVIGSSPWADRCAHARRAAPRSAALPATRGPRVEDWGR